MTPELKADLERHDNDASHRGAYCHRNEDNTHFCIMRARAALKGADE